MITLEQITECALNNDACDTYLQPFLYAIDNKDYLLAYKIVALKIDWLQSMCSLDISLDDIPVNIDGESKIKLYHDISIKVNFLNKKIYGDYIIYNTNINNINGDDIITDTYTYRNGILNGKCEHFYLTSGIKRASYYFKDNQRHGEYLTYHRNGKIKGISNYINGIVDGEVKVFHENGELEKISFFRDAHLHGEYKTYYDDKKVKTIGKYENGDRIGRFITFNKDGKIIEESSYIAGCLDKVIVFIYDIDGNVIERITDNNNY